MRPCVATVIVGTLTRVALMLQIVHEISLDCQYCVYFSPIALNCVE